MKNLPDQYKWLLEVGTLPRMVSLGLAELGTAEVVGKGSNPKIIAWRDELNKAGAPIKNYTDDDIAWCGLLAAILALRRSGIAAEVVKDPLWADNWRKYGVESPRPALGDILTFRRPGGNHVGIYIAEDVACFHVLGGNQGNSVTITRIAKSRLTSARRPPYKSMPASVKPYRVAASGTISRNEG